MGRCRHGAGDRLAERAHVRVPWIRGLGRAAFTLVETLIALVLSSFIMILVSTTFLVQNRYQANQVLLAGAHDNVRAATELVARELRSAVDEGVRVAERHSLTVRSPIVVGTVCARSGFLGTVVDVHTEGGSAALDIDAVAGVGIPDTDGSWDYATASWGFVDGGDSGSAVRCAANGADTTGVSDEFHSLRRLYLLFGFGNTPEVGALVLLFRETTFSIGPSEMEPSTLGLFRAAAGADPIEFATGIDSTAHFEYRTGGSTYADAVASGSVDDIDAVRLVLDARRRGESGPDGDVTFGWTTNVVLRNAP